LRHHKGAVIDLPGNFDLVHIDALLDLAVVVPAIPLRQIPIINILNG